MDFAIIYQHLILLSWISKMNLNTLWGLNKKPSLMVFWAFPIKSLTQSNLDNPLAFLSQDLERSVVCITQTLDLIKSVTIIQLTSWLPLTYGNLFMNFNYGNVPINGFQQSSPPPNSSKPLPNCSKAPYLIQTFGERIFEKNDSSNCTF